MNKITFTKKHIILSIISLLILLIISSVVVTTLILPKNKVLAISKTEVVKLDSDIASLKKKANELSNGVPLLKAPQLNAKPQITSQAQFKAYLTGLDEKRLKGKIILKKVTFEEKQLFVSASDASKILYSNQVVIDFDANAFESVLLFVQALENDIRYITPVSFRYGFSKEAMSSELAYENTISFNIYYLKMAPVAEEEIKK